MRRHSIGNHCKLHVKKSEMPCSSCDLIEKLCKYYIIHIILKAYVQFLS